MGLTFIRTVSVSSLLASRQPDYTIFNLIGNIATWTRTRPP
uniref:Uncharacterized protein n=1 Tax=Anguilla anguilla TaxID=7936 RepID=A0A0E9SG68_ANGAN